MISREHRTATLWVVATALVSAVAVYPQAATAADLPPAADTQFGPWHWQTPLPQGNNLRGVFVSDASTVTIVGEEFTIVRTDDQGATWVFQGPNPLLTGGVITDVFFPDSSTGFAVPTMSFSNMDPEVPILRTIDGGETWTAHSSGMPRGSQFNDVHFTDVDNGWAGGGLGNGVGGSCEGPMLLRTINGGSSWEDFSNAPGLVTDATCPTVKAIHFLDITTGFVLMNRAATDGTALFRTTDGGSSWTGIVTPATINRQDLFMIDAATGIMTTGTDGIWHTADGGDTWTQRYPNGNLPSVTFVDADHGWAVGNVGATPLILHTADGGLTWTSQPSNTPQGLFLGDVHFHDSGTGYVVGRSGVVLRTTNGGTTWENLSSGHEIFDRLNDVTFVDAVTGWAVGFQGIIVHTSDGGANWALQNGGTGLFLGAVSFVNSDRGWIAGDAGTILHTTNGGESWAPQSTGSAATLFDLQFVDAASGWAVGALGTILHTVNGGATWFTQDSGTTMDLHGVSFVDADTGWAVGHFDTILHTPDGGESWMPQDVPDVGAGDFILLDVHFVDANQGWVVGRVQGGDLGGVILRTTDGGDTWTLQKSGISVSANGISFADTAVGTVVGANGTVLRTEDGGATWTPETRRTNGALESVAMIDADTAAWTVGVPGGGFGSGLILRRGSVDVLPQVMILEPKDGSTFVEGDSVTFVGSAVNAEGGDISPSLEWDSSLDGPIGSGASFTTSTLSPGSHTINAAVTDAGGLPGADSISVTIEPIGGTPPEIDIDPVSLSSELPQGQMETQALTVTNLGDNTLDWTILDEDGVLERDIRTVGLETTLTHSNSPDILSDNTFACFSQSDGTTRANSFLRTFTLSDFDIFEVFDVTEVTFGVQELTAAASITVNLYTLEGEFTFDNLTLIGSITEELAPQEQTLVTLEVAGTAPAGSTLVLEIAAPELVGVAAFRAGSNDLGETAPSYLATAACGITEPRPYAEVFGGFPNVHLVMTVTGETVEPVDCSLPDWVGVEPSSGSVPGGEDQVVNVTFDATDLAPSAYEANLCLASNDPETPLAVVPLDLTVTAPVPIADIAPASFSFEVPQGQGASDTLHIGNLGTADLVWSAAEAEGAPLGGGTDVVADGGFEAGSPNPSWEEGSTNFDTPLCPVACGTGGGTGPHGGGWWAWFGGINAVETGFVAQQVTLPASGSAELRFWLEIPLADNAGFLDVSLGGDVIFSVTEADAVSYATYTEVVIDVSAYADGGTHELRFDSTTQPGSGFTNFFVDDVSLTVVESGPCDSPVDVLWLSVTPAGGTTPPEDSVPVEVAVDTSALELGDYAAQLCVTTNDPAAPLVPVPVALTVTEHIPVERYIPVALMVDPEARVSDGNGVFEPGELVDVAPSWLNDGEVAQSLMGEAANFTGPEGADYMLAAGSTDYGLVEPGAIASCLDTEVCYQLGVNDPAARPATHWMAAFDETLSDDTTKTWSLHIGDSFTDVPPSTLFYQAIETLLHHGVTGGCTATEYCPTGGNTRGQMAVFLLKAAEDPGYLPPDCTEDGQVFADVPFDSIFCPWVEELASRGVTAGCGGGNYCPGDSVTRGQMAVFLLKAFEGPGYAPPACTSEFTDVLCPSLFAAWIEELALREITAGCGGGNYCPNAPVTRGQMAVFITKTFGLTLYGP